jgi:hypothetical protein
MIAARSLLACAVYVVGTLSSACTARHRSVPDALPLSAFSVPIRYLPGSPFGWACLPRTGDSTFFQIHLIVDSTRERESGAFAVILNPRNPPRAGYINQVVSIDLQQAGSSRIRGTSCWHDAGIVVRAAAQPLQDAIISLDPRLRVEVQVFDRLQRRIAPVRQFEQPSEGGRINWSVPPPNGEL